jgi:hypothetical protein
MATLIELRDDVLEGACQLRVYQQEKVRREVQLRHQRYVEDFRVEVR